MQGPMRIVYHLGAHCTDDDRLVRCLLKNRALLADQGITVPSPTRYRKLLRDTVMQLRGWLPNEIGGVYWVYLDNPYFSPYIPIYTGNLNVAETYNIYDPNKYDEKSARWAIDSVDNLANLNFQNIAKDVQKVRDPFEAELFSNQQQIEEKALALYKKDPNSAREFLTNYSNDKMNKVTEMFLNLRDQIITDYTNNHE